MPRRLTGNFDVKRRPEGGAVITFKTPTGESFEFERNPDEIKALIEALSGSPETPSSPASGRRKTAAR